MTFDFDPDPDPDPELDNIHLDDFDWESGKNSEWTPLQVLGGVAAAAGIVGVGLLIGKLLSSGDEEKKKRDNDNRRF